MRAVFARHFMCCRKKETAELTFVLELIGNQLHFPLEQSAYLEQLKPRWTMPGLLP